MTLLELLVVVAILAVLATVAIQSTSDLGDQTRYESTQKSLATFRDVVLGPANQVTPDGSPLVTGYVADMGRPPRSTLLTHPDLGGLYDLGELYSETLPSGLRPYGLYQATAANTSQTLITVVSNTALLADSLLRIGAGWRGPYVRKPGSEVTLVDGWSKPLVSRMDLGSSLAEINAWPTMLLAFRTNSTTQPFNLPEDAYFYIVSSTLLDRPVRERPVAVCFPLPSFVVHDAPESLLPHPLPFVLSQSTRRSDRLYPGLTTLGHQS